MSDPAYPRSLDDLSPLTAGEAVVLERAVAGGAAQLSHDALPGDDPDRTVRAGLIRFLLLGGSSDYPCHEKGVTVVGARITGELDLELCTVAGRLNLWFCDIPGGINLHAAVIAGLSLDGSKLSVLQTSHLVSKGSVHLRRGFVAEMGVDLTGARIGGQLACNGGRFFNPGGHALAAQGAVIDGDVMLRDGFVANGTVNFSGAVLRGQLECVRAAMQAETDNAFAMQGTQVAEIFYWRDMDVAAGNVVLTGAVVGALADDTKSWPEDGRLMMDGFRYGRFVYTDTTARRRLRWLAKHTSNAFQPQPYQQLARVIGEMGHRYDRGKVLIEMEERLRAQQRRDMRAGGGRVPAWLRPGWNALRVGLHWVWDRLLRLVVGYGYRPWRAFIGATVLIALVWAISAEVWRQGDFAPNAAPVLVSAAWQEAALDPDIANPAAHWSRDDGPGRDYETFRPWIYAVDVVVPIVNLGQDDAWAPSTSRGPWGRFAHGTEWIVRVLGWVITALAAGAVAGVIRNE